MDMKISAYRQSVQDTPLKEGDVVYATNIKEGIEAEEQFKLGFKTI